jgi:regulatory protein
VADSEVTAVDVRRAAMDLLARREHSRQELQRKLARRFAVDAEVIFSVINQLTQEGLQSDQRLAEALLRYRSNRGQGPLKIKAEMREKCIESDLIEQIFDEANIDWFDLALRVLEKRYGDGSAVDASERAKRTRFLQQRGFSFDQIQTVMG